MSYNKIHQSKVDDAEGSEKSSKDRAYFHLKLFLFVSVLFWGGLHLDGEDIVINLPWYLYFFGFIGGFVYFCFTIQMLNDLGDELAKLRSNTCPKCKSKNSYLLTNSEVVNSWGQWEMQDFVDRTQNAKGELIATTTRKQQVWVNYVRRRFTRECNKCGCSSTWEALD